MPVMLTSCASLSTEPPDSGRTTPTCLLLTRSGGRATGTGWRARPRRPAEAAQPNTPRGSVYPPESTGPGTHGFLYSHSFPLVTPVDYIPTHTVSHYY